VGVEGIWPVKVEPGVDSTAPTHLVCSPSANIVSTICDKNGPELRVQLLPVVPANSILGCHDHVTPRESTRI